MKKKTKMIKVIEFTKVATTLNLKKFCQDAGVNYRTIWGKIQRGSEFTVTESVAIAQQLDKLGINFAEVEVEQKD